MKRLLIAALFTAAACASHAKPDDAPPPAPEALDQCKASQYQWLIGRKKEELPPKPQGAVWRLACTECQVTMDFNPNRLNVFFDKETEVIKQVRCG